MRAAEHEEYPRSSRPLKPRPISGGAARAIPAVRCPVWMYKSDSSAARGARRTSYHGFASIPCPTCEYCGATTNDMCHSRAARPRSPGCMAVGGRGGRAAGRVAAATGGGAGRGGGVGGRRRWAGAEGLASGHAGLRRAGRRGAGAGVVAGQVRESSRGGWHGHRFRHATIDGDEEPPAEESTSGAGHDRGRAVIAGPDRGHDRKRVRVRPGRPGDGPVRFARQVTATTTQLRRGQGETRPLHRVQGS